MNYLLIGFIPYFEFLIPPLIPEIPDIFVEIDPKHFESKFPIMPCPAR